MLTRATWILTPLEDVVLPRTFNLALVKELHHRMGLKLGDEAIPSTTCSGLLGKMIPSQEFFSLPKLEPYTLSLCGLQKNASEAIADLDLSHQFEFLGVTFQVAAKPLISDSYEALYQNWVVMEPEPTYQHSLHFRSPTSFSQDSLYLPLPIPRLMFRSWLERWNHFSTIYLGGDDLLDYLGQAIAVRHCSIHTRSVMIYRGNIPGFIGQVRLNILKRSDPLLVNVARLLLQYSLYSGTGIKTRLGMGSVNLEG